MLRVFYTGLGELETTVNVTPGQTVERDFSLAARSTTGSDATVQLDAFVIQSTKETDAAAIAVNEQRFAKNMVSARPLRKPGHRCASPRQKTSASNP